MRRVRLWHIWLAQLIAMAACAWCGYQFGLETRLLVDIKALIQ